MRGGKKGTIGLKTCKALRRVGDDNEWKVKVCRAEKSGVHIPPYVRRARAKRASVTVLCF